MISRILLFLLLSALALTSHAAITNITPITEVNTVGNAELVTGVSRNELYLSFNRITFSPTFSSTTYLTSRTTTLNPFNPPSTDAFSLILVADETFGGCYLSDDGLRMYYAVDKSTGNLAELYYTERLSTAEPFPAGTELTSLNSSGYESSPRLTSDELRIVFASDRNGFYQSFEATRSDTASPFSAPIQLSEISTAYSMLDISSDGLTIFLTTSSGTAYSAATRPTLASAFGTPFLIHSVSSSDSLYAAVVNSDASRIYYSQGPYSQLEAIDIYAGDLDLTPPPTPTPTATPTPSPTPFDTSTLPPIDMPVEPSAVPGDLIADVKIRCGATDAQGRFYFFVQRSGVNYTLGLNTLMRATPSMGGGATLEAIATQTQLAAADAGWDAGDMTNVATSIDLFSDDSIALSYFTADSADVLRVVPGSPPTVTALGSLTGVDPAQHKSFMIVDRGQTPNVIYLSHENDIYTIPAAGGTPTMWLENAVNYWVESMAIDLNGDVLAIDTYLGINRLDKDTKAKTQYWLYGSSGGLGWYGGHDLVVHPVTGDVFGIYTTLGPPTHYDPALRTMNMFKLPAAGGGDFGPAEIFMLGTHILEDPDVLPWASPEDEIVAPGSALTITRDGKSLWFSNDTNLQSPFIAPGTSGVIRIGTSQATAAHSDLWLNLE